MIFMCTYQLDRDKQAETQAFFANMTDEQIAGEYPADVKQIGRWHDAANGSGVIIVDTDNQESLTGLFWNNVSSAEFKLPNQDYSEIKSVYSYGDKKLIVVSEEMFESIWIYDPLTKKQTKVKNVWNFIDYTSSVVSYKKSDFDLKPRLAVITENE